jgi:hypothetical protein
LSRGLSRHTTASTPSGGMPGRAGGVAPGGRTATHTESTLYIFAHLHAAKQLIRPMQQGLLWGSRAVGQRCRIDFRKVVTHSGATLRFSMMICIMRLGRHKDAQAPLWNRRSYAINRLIPPKSPRYNRSGYREVAVCLSRFLLLRSL